MTRDFLGPLFERLFSSRFDYKNHSRKMRSVVYLLEAMGVDTGGYCFSWYKQGPFCLQLDCALSDLDRKRTRNEELRVSRYALEKIDQLKKAICMRKDIETTYTEAIWVELLATIMFCETSLHTNNNGGMIFEALKEKAPHLDDQEANNYALKVFRDRLTI